MKKIFFALPLILLCLSSCSKDDELKRNIELLRSKPVVLKTDSMRCFMNGKDTIVHIKHEALKYVIYTDAQSCVSCTLKNIHLWNEILDESKQYGERLVFLFIFAPKQKDIHSLELTLKTYSPNCPVYIDTLNIFEKDNPNILSSKMLHTLLLDEKNQVLLVGNPLRNKKINKMFHDIMNGETKK